MEPREIPPPPSSLPPSSSSTSFLLSFSAFFLFSVYLSFPAALILPPSKTSLYSLCSPPPHLSLSHFIRVLLPDLNLNPTGPGFRLFCQVQVMWWVQGSDYLQCRDCYATMTYDTWLFELFSVRCITTCHLLTVFTFIAAISSIGHSKPNELS